MKAWHFEGLVRHEVEQVVLRRVPPEDPYDFHAPHRYEVWAFNHQGLWPRGMGNRLVLSAKPGVPRTWADLNAAVNFIRGKGWRGTIEVEEP